MQLVAKTPMTCFRCMVPCYDIVVAASQAVVCVLLITELTANFIGLHHGPIANLYMLLLPLVLHWSSHTGS